MAAERTYSRRLLLLDVGAPAVIALVAAAVLLAALPTLPSVVTVHWSASGVADKTAPPALALIALPASVVFGLIVWAVLREPANVRSAAAPRLLTGTSVGFAIAVGAGVPASLLVAARSDGSFPWVVLAAAVVVAAVLGAAAASLVPAPPLGRPRDSVSVAPLHLAGSERAVWVGRAAPSAVVAGVLAAAAALLAVLAVLLAVFVAPVLLVLAVPALAAAAAAPGWRIRIDAHGAVVRGALPPFVLRVGIDDLARAGVTTVAPVSDFGGWGPRRRRGTTGIVSRAGEALELERVHGDRLIVTIDGAAEAAALVTALIARRNEHRPVSQQH